jgi:hypothetical protein
MTNSQRRGVTPALMTKFKAEKRLGRAAMERQWALPLETGVPGPIVPGSSGERAALTCRPLQSFAATRTDALCGPAADDNVATVQVSAPAVRPGLN